MKDFIDLFISNTQTLGWAAAFVVFLVVEGVTLNALVSIWFAAAAFLAMIASMAGVGFVGQLLIFVVSSIVFLILTRSLVKRFKKKDNADPNKDYDIGKTGVVIEDICNVKNTGRVKLDDVDWMARSEDGTIIPADTIVTVKQVDGAKLIVSR